MNCVCSLPSTFGGAGPRCPREAQALENIKNGFMTATAWQDSYTEGLNMIKLLPDIQKAGASWQPKAVEVPAVLVTKETVEAFTGEHPDALK